MKEMFHLSGEPGVMQDVLRTIEVSKFLKALIFLFSGMIEWKCISK
jgi:hypothetical protein